MKRVGVAVVVALGLGGLGLAVPAGAQALITERAAKHVGIAAPSDVSEGDRYFVVAHVPSPRSALKATLEYEMTDRDANWLDTVSDWTVLKSVKVHGRGAIKFPMQADTAREYTFRVRVSYRGVKRPVASRSANVNYWHWVGLPYGYYSVGNGFDTHNFASFSIAGHATSGWYLSSGMSAEDRYTMPGRCKSFHAVLGLADDSADGTTGTITFSTIDSSGIPKPIWKSPTLVPGKTVPVSFSLASPYRFSILGENTSTPVTSGSTTIVPKAQPAASDPEFLCHVD